MRYWRPDLRSVRDGEWYLFDGNRKIAVLRVVELGTQKERMIRSVTWAPRSEDRWLVGYFPHLRMAAEVTWLEYQKELERDGATPPPPPRRG
ncbi:hypothetical protein ACFWGP_05295 [Agromyces sp. NPDC127015]|uniref:hypothetical protein n=1 Tax=Agromyces sp. NPDC127015 TaxID=3347108 RepID=UPI00365F30D3